MITDTKPQPGKGSSDVEDLLHLWCTCTPDTAQCGYTSDRTTRETFLNPPIEDRCVVCQEFANQACRFCGTFT